MITELKQINVHSIRLDGGTQPRVEMSESLIAEYAEAMREGDEFDPIEIVQDGIDLWLVDGYHRVYAAREAGLEQISAKVTLGTQRDAILRSVGANAKHGLRRTTADRRAAARRLLMDEEWVMLSDRAIGEYCKVSHGLVGSVRAELIASGQIASQEERIVQRNGSQMTMNTGKIGSEQGTKTVAVKVTDYDVAGVSHFDIDVERDKTRNWLSLYTAVAEDLPEALVFMKYSEAFPNQVYAIYGENASVLTDVMGWPAPTIVKMDGYSLPRGIVVLADFEFQGETLATLAKQYAVIVVDAAPGMKEIPQVRDAMARQREHIQETKKRAAAPPPRPAWLENYYQLRKQSAVQVMMISTGKSGFVKLLLDDDAEFAAKQLVTPARWEKIPGDTYHYVLKLHIPSGRPRWFLDFQERIGAENIEFVGLHYPELKSFVDSLPTAEPRLLKNGAATQSLPPQPEQVPAELTFPIVFGNTTITRAYIGIERVSGWLANGSKGEKRYSVALTCSGMAGKQENDYGVTTKKIGEDQIELSTGGATKSLIPLTEWIAFIDRLPVQIVGNSKTTIQMNELLAQMCRDVIAGRRKAPTEKEWKEEEKQAQEAAAPPDLIAEAIEMTVNLGVMLHGIQQDGIKVDAESLSIQELMVALEDALEAAERIQRGEA